MWNELRKVVVVGASGGIGRAFVELLADGSRSVFAAARTDPGPLPANCHPVFLDLEDEVTIEAAAVTVGDGVDGVFVASGMLHDSRRRIRPEKALRQLRSDVLATSFAINAIGPILVAKHFVPRMSREELGVFAALSARVGSIGDNRVGGWFGYRASKAALNQFLRTASIEFRRTHPHLLCVGLHPGTVDTSLSEPFQRGVPEAKLFAPEFSVQKMLHVLAHLTPADSGRVFAWDGAPVPD